jgi:uncharacterized protein
MKSIDVLRRFVSVILIGYALGFPAQAESIHCRDARSNVERLICDRKTNPGLLSLDFDLNTFYEHAVQHAKEKKKFIHEQNVWIKDVRNVCNDAECLRNAYKSRIGELQQATTLCSSQEVVVFSCVLPREKVASLCASQDASVNTGYMQYRIGLNQTNLDMQFPQEKTPAKNHFKYLNADYKGTHAVSFWLDGNRYSVYSTMTSLRLYNSEGLIVSHGHPPVRVSHSKCISHAIVFDEILSHYSSINIFSLDKKLGLPKAKDDISYAGEKDWIKPGELEPGSGDDRDLK